MADLINAAHIKLTQPGTAADAQGLNPTDLYDLFIEGQEEKLQLNATLNQGTTEYFLLPYSIDEALRRKKELKQKIDEAKAENPIGARIIFISGESPDRIDKKTDVWFVTMGSIFTGAGLIGAGTTLGFGVAVIALTTIYISILLYRGYQDRNRAVNQAKQNHYQAETPSLNTTIPDPRVTGPETTMQNTQTINLNLNQL